MASNHPSASLRLRFLSAAILAPIVIAIVVLGDPVFSLLILVTGLLMAWEWARITEGQKWLPTFILLALGVFSLIAGLYLDNPMLAIAIPLSSWIAALLMAGVLRRKWLWPLLGFPYVLLPTAAFLLLRANDISGQAVVLWLLVLVWFADSLAFAVGKTVGGPKLWPRVSPGKTWSGLMGAVVGGMIAGAGAALWFADTRVIALAGLGGALAIWEQGGDLAESALKRHFGVKDSSHLIPGHGGILDRVDGLVAVVVGALIIGWWHSGSLENAAAGILIWP